MAGVGLCALASRSLPAALATKDTTTVVTVEAPVVPHGRRAERAKAESAPQAPVAPSTVASPVAAPPEVAGAGHRRRPDGDGAPGAQPAAPGAGGGRSRRAAGEAPAARARGRGGGTSATDGTSSSGVAEGAGAAAASGGRTTSAGVESLARKQKKTGGGEKGGGKKRKEKERERGRESSPPGETESSKGQGSGAKSKPTMAPESTSPPLAAAVPAAAPAGGTGTATLVALAPSVSSVGGLGAGGTRAGHAPGRRRVAHRATARSAHAPAAATAPLTASLAPLAASASSGATGGAAHPRSGLGGSYTRSSEPAIVHTITRIVDVVPGPMRILIAALAAIALALGVRSLLSGIRTRRLVRQRGELLADVGLLQAALLPNPPARLGPVGTTVAYRPADGPGAGGDFYDVFALEAGQLAVIVGDVSGHGRDALPHTALVRFTVRAYLEAGLSPSDALQTAGTVLERQLGGSLATVLAAIYHPRERTLTYAAAGHPPPIVLAEPDESAYGDAAPDANAASRGAASAIAPVIACSAPPVGAGMRTGTRQTVVSVPGPARLCLHTDGVTEARVGEQLFGAERLSRTLARLPVGAGASELLDAVAAQASARPDDMAACMLHVHGGAGDPTIVSELLELAGEQIDERRVRRFLAQCGVGGAEAAAAIERARRELIRAGKATVELRYENGAPVVSVREEHVIRAAALSAVRAS
ncbi:MAG TPA: PP2C family protein-serine/threonine phosphatase [Solirubrobacteraceae bacterium]|nr:PP2C family protein-serine/threonine phosphatase [Solirubrobacteraceae bacterium]